MRLRKIFTVRTISLNQIWNGVHAQGIHTHVQPEAHHLQHFFQHSGVIKIEVGLVREEAMPEIFLRNGVIGPVGLFRISENNASVTVFVICRAPHIELALRRACVSMSSSLKPGMLIGGVVDHQFDHHLHVAVMRSFQKCAEVLNRSVVGMHVHVVGNVIAIITQR